MSRKILAAISGGVDSAVAVPLLRDAGYEVIGATLRLLPDMTDEVFELQSRGVTTLAEKLGIEHHFLDYRAEFCDAVLRPSWEMLCHGLTPNPCALCNPRIKFGKLIQFAHTVGAESVATGHYARICRDAAGIPSLHRGLDPAKDQTYFLFGLSHEQLCHIAMPLGDYTKNQVREMARRMDLPNAENPESQDACFVSPDASFAGTLQDLLGGSGKMGWFIGPDGKRLARHDGLQFYTIGQRKGLRIALGKPAYVSKIDPESGDVFLAVDDDSLMTGMCRGVSVNWQNGQSCKEPFECLIQIRYRSRAVPGTVFPLENGDVRIVFQDPQRAVTPGQGAVFYSGTQLLGGAFIRS